MPTKRKPTRAKQLGVTSEQYEAMLAAQGGGCAICGNPPKTRRLHVDHDHKTGNVRGLLCHKHNRGLAYFSDDADMLYRAGDYLDNAPGGPMHRPRRKMPTAHDAAEQWKKARRKQ
jgi:hypothetical protein